LIEALKAGVRFWQVSNYDAYLKEKRIPTQTGHDAMIGDKGELIIAVSSSSPQTFWNVEIDSKDIRQYLDGLPNKSGDADGVKGLASLTSSPGPKAGERTPKDQHCNKALEIMGLRNIPRGHGYLTKIAKQVKTELKSAYELNSIVKDIRSTVREWEKNNPA
jgi:hypothetical protein